MKFSIATRRVPSIAVARELMYGSDRDKPIILSDLSYGATRPHQILADFKLQGFDFYSKAEFSQAVTSAVEAIEFGRLSFQNLQSLYVDECRGNLVIRAIEASAQLILASLRRGDVSEILFVPPLAGIQLDSENEWLLWFLFSRASLIERESFGFLVGESEHWKFPEFVDAQYLGPIRVEPIESAADLINDLRPSFSSVDYRLVTPSGLLASSPAIEHLTAVLGSSGKAWVPPCIREMCNRVTRAEGYHLQIQAAGAAFLMRNTNVPSVSSRNFEREIVKRVQKWALSGGQDCAHRLLDWAISSTKDSCCALRLSILKQWLLLSSSRCAELAAYDATAYRHTAPPSLEGEMLFLKGWGQTLSGDAHTAIHNLKAAMSLLAAQDEPLRLPYLQNILAQAYARSGMFEHADDLLQAIARGNIKEKNQLADLVLNRTSQLSLAKLCRLGGNSPSALEHLDRAFPSSRPCVDIAEAMFSHACRARIFSSGDKLELTRSHWLSAALYFVANPVPEAMSSRHLQIFLPNYCGSPLRAIDWISVWLIHTLGLEHLCGGTESEAAVFISDFADPLDVAGQSLEAWVMPDRTILASGRFTPTSMNEFVEHTRLRRGLTKLLCQEVAAPTLPRTFIVPTLRRFEDTDLAPRLDLVLEHYHPFSIRTKRGVPHISDEECRMRDEASAPVRETLHFAGLR